MIAVPDDLLHERLRQLLGLGWIDMREYPVHGGTGQAGKLLEHLLGLDGGNLDTPDAGKWEIKFHGGNALITLFHLEAEPRGHLEQMVRTFGWPDAHGRTSFRHTIHGRSPRGFSVEDEGERVVVRNADAPDLAPYWTHDRLLAAFAGKFRRLIVVTGETRDLWVRYEKALSYRDPRITRFIEAVVHGTIAIDFDARTTDTGGIRNHGTKFRVKETDLAGFYSHQDEFQA